MREIQDNRLENYGTHKYTIDNKQHEINILMIIEELTMNKICNIIDRSETGKSS